MKKFLAFVFLLVLVVLAWFMVDIKQTEDGKMPEVSVDGARLPKFDVDMGSIEVKREDKTVTVPEVQVGSQEKHIQVPKWGVPE